MTDRQARLTEEVLERLERLDRAGTQAPWAWDSRGEKRADVQIGLAADRDGRLVGGYIDDGDDVIYIEGIARMSGTNPSADARLAVEARNVLPSLTAQVRALCRERDVWKETAAQGQRNTDYYRGLVVAIGELLGTEAYIADDGRRADGVLCAKVPELVKQRLEQAEERERRLREVQTAMAEALKAAYHDLCGPQHEQYPDTVEKITSAYRQHKALAEGKEGQG